MNSGEVEPERPEKTVQADVKIPILNQGDPPSAELNQNPATRLEAEALEYQHDLRKLAWSIVIALFLIGISVIGYAQYTMLSNEWHNEELDAQKKSLVDEINSRNRDYFIRNNRKRPYDEAMEEIWAAEEKIEGWKRKQESNRDMRSELLQTRTIGLGVLALAIILMVFMLIGKLRRERVE
ncbi:hypothetical protein CA11_44890 [Gimesia maris]|uniref:hypothetical protein n=1 Tax=Gimesia maris TaxID=122 RepID=UPI00118C7A83|nr:hypothetical protein [Gimesia maris]QDU16657.1 hypothetical protein CA11_44890 [Gimesia maris]